MSKRNLTVLIPAHNEDTGNIKYLTKTFDKHKIPYVIVDDGSEIPIKGALRRKHKGYGAAIKHGIRNIKSKYIGIIDADGQYDPLDLVHLWESIGHEDMIIGKRVISQGGWKRLLGRFFLRISASCMTGHYIPDLNSGIRIFKRHIAKSYSSILCDEFSFTSTLTAAMLLDGYAVKWFPVEFFPRQGSSSTVKLIYHGLVTLYQIIFITMGLRTRGIRKWLRER